jgi:hypothetical protein
MVRERSEVFPQLIDDDKPGLSLSPNYREARFPGTNPVCEADVRGR